MKHIYQYFQNLRTKRQGYSLAEIIFQAETYDSHYIGKPRQTQQAAINDALRYSRSHPEADNISVYAFATLTDIWADTQTISYQHKDTAHLGDIVNGTYYSWGEQIDWLEKA